MDNDNTTRCFTAKLFPNVYYRLTDATTEFYHQQRQALLSVFISPLAMPSFYQIQQKSSLYISLFCLQSEKVSYLNCSLSNRSPQPIAKLFLAILFKD